MKAFKVLLSTTAIFVMLIAAFILGQGSAAGRFSFLRFGNSETRALAYGQTGSMSGFGMLFNVRDLVEQNYVNDLDKEKQQAMVYGSIRGMLKGVGDQYTRFMDPTAYKNMTIETKGKFGGIGILIGIRNEQLTVMAPLEDTPAFRAGLKSGDIIIKINDVSTEDMALDDAVARIRGEQGTKVKLTLWRPGFDPKNGKDFELVRDEIKLKDISEKKMIGDDIAYIRFESFGQTTAESIRKELIAFKKQNARGLILDLRDNPGGLLDAAIDVSNLFIDEGPIVHRVGRNKPSQTYYAEPGKKIWDMPMVVLVNGYSASASEILSGALQDDGVATLIGEKTFGKGLVQTVYTLPDNAAVLITTDKYLTAKKRDINTKGIVPDITIKEGLADAHEKSEVDGEKKDSDRVGKFPMAENKKKANGDGIVIFNGIPRSDVSFHNLNSKKFIEADDLQKLFGVGLKFDKDTNSLIISNNPEDIKDDKKADPVLDKGVEVLKEKIAAAAKKKK